MSQQMLTLMMPDAVNSTTPVTSRPILEWARSLPMYRHTYSVTRR